MEHLIHAIITKERQGVTVEKFHEDRDIVVSKEVEWQWLQPDTFKNYWNVKAQEESRSARLRSPAYRYRELGVALVDIEELCGYVGKTFLVKDGGVKSGFGTPGLRVMVGKAGETMSMEHRIRLTTTLMIYEEVQNAVVQNDHTTADLDTSMQDFSLSGTEETSATQLGLNPPCTNHFVSPFEFQGMLTGPDSINSYICSPQHSPRMFSFNQHAATLDPNAIQHWLDFCLTLYIWSRDITNQVCTREIGGTVVDETEGSEGGPGSV
jgi:hypothetical protein